MSSSETSRCTAAAVCATRKKNEGPVIFTNVSSTAPLAPRQPPLTITYTNDGATVANWLQRHVGADVCCVGFDTETVPSFRRTSAQSAAPATLQLATSEGACLVVHLAHVPRKNCFVSPASQGRIKDAPDGKGLLRLRGMDELAEVLNSTRVMKVGVGIDQDAIEMWRDHRMRLSGRFDLGGIGATSKNRLQGLQKLSEMVVPGLELAKSKRISMSDWSVVPLTPKQIEYAASDAYSAAIIFSTLLHPPLHSPQTCQHGNFTHSPHAESLPTLDIERLRTAVLKRERPVADMEGRATRRRAAKLEIQARETVLDLAANESLATPDVKPQFKKLLRDLSKSTREYNKRLEAARKVFRETRPLSPLLTEDFEKLGMMRNVSKTTPF